MVLVLIIALAVSLGIQSWIEGGVIGAVILINVVSLLFELGLSHNCLRMQMLALLHRLFRIDLGPVADRLIPLPLCNRASVLCSKQILGEHDERSESSQTRASQGVLLGQDDGLASFAGFSFGSSHS